MKKRILLASTVALSFAPVLATQAEEVGLKNADTAKAKKNQCMKRLIDNVKRMVRF